MPSLVSMPPNIITAVFDTISRRRQRGRRVRKHTFAMIDRPADVPVEGGDGLGRPVTDLATGRYPVDGCDDLVVPAQHDTGLDVEEVQRGRHDAHGQRSGDVAPDLRATAGCEGR